MSIHFVQYDVKRKHPKLHVTLRVLIIVELSFPTYYIIQEIVKFNNNTKIGAPMEPLYFSILISAEHGEWCLDKRSAKARIGAYY